MTGKQFSFALCMINYLIMPEIVFEIKIYFYAVELIYNLLILLNLTRMNKTYFHPLNVNVQLRAHCGVFCCENARHCDWKSVGVNTF
jgi:hypothetical protein